MPHIDKIVIFHDDFYLSRDDAFKKFKRKIQIKALFSFSKIFCVSDYSKNSLIRLGIKDKKLAVINQGIDTNIYFPPKTDKRPIQDKYIISMGSNRPRKNFEYIFKVFALLKDKYKNLKLIIIGAEQHSKDTINILQFFDNIPHLKGEVLVKGFIDKSELSHYIANAELLLFPSLKEGFGLPIIEAQACGTPVITSNIPPMNQLVPYTELLVNPLDADDICNKCNQLLSNPTYLKEKIEQGLDFVKKYDWYKSAKLIENHMHDCNYELVVPEK